MKKKNNGESPVFKKMYEFDLVVTAKSEKNAHIRVKLLALEQIKIGRSYHEVAKIFQVHQKTIKQWVMRFEAEGPDGLTMKPGRGRKTILPKSEIANFKQAIAILQKERPGGRINVADITKMAKEKFNAAYKEKGMYDFLHRIDMVWISARSVHPAHDSGAQELFKKNLYQWSKN